MRAQTLSVKELRENLPQVRQGLGEGLTYLLIYRSQPIAEIRPLGKKQGAASILRTLSNPPTRLQISTERSSVKLVRSERD